MKKKTRRWKHPRFIILFVIAIAISSVGIFLYLNRTTEIDHLQMSVMDTLEKKDVTDHVDARFKQDYQIQDYGIYGQTLSLYRKDYGKKETDALVGQMVVLRNVQTEEETSYILGESIDSGIQLGSLEEGLYELYLYDNYDRKRIYFDDAFDSEPLSTIRSQKNVKDVVLHADKDYLQDYGITYEKNYAFLEVMENIPQVIVADVVLDPGGNVYNEQTMVNEEGIVTNWIHEPQTTWEFAQLVKKELEDKGLRVVFTRDKETSDSYYGTSSRVGKGYEAQAKVYLSFEVFEDEDLYRPYFLTSRYASGFLANEMAYAFDQKELELSSISHRDYQASSVGYDIGLEPEDSKRMYDAYPQLRETGGKLTFTGTLEQSKANRSFGESYGMESVLFMLANATKEESVNYYQEHKEEMAKQIAEAICSYYGVQGENSETASQ